MPNSGWHAVDLDGTLAVQVHPFNEMEIGPPIAPMLARVKAWLAAGERVKILTARVADHNPKIIKVIQLWCRLHVGQPLDVTAEKDYLMIDIWDDRAVQVEHNTGRRVDGVDDGFNPPAAAPKVR